MKVGLFSGISALAISLAVAPACADVQVVYKGMVSSGYDQTGLFDIGTDLAGYTYTATFVFDPTRGNVLSSPTSNYAFGGEVNSNASPAISALITINGITEFIGIPDYFGSIAGYNDGTYSYQYHEADYSNNDVDGIFVYNYSYDSIFNYAGTIPASILSPLSYNFDPATDSSYGYFQFYAISDDSLDPSLNTYAYLNPSSLTVSSIPEPSTWITMLVGFAGLGMVCYRRMGPKRRAIAPSQT